MNTKLRLTRKPLTTLLWGILALAMSVFLCIGSALWFSTSNLARVLDEHHAAVAYRLDRGVQRGDEPVENDISYTMQDRNLTEEQVAALAAMDSVKGVHFHTLCGGYSPSFEPVLGVTNGMVHSFERYHQSTESYKEVMIVGTVDRVHWMEDDGLRDVWPLMDQEIACSQGYYLVNVEQIVLAHESYQIETAIAENQQFNVSVSFYGEDAPDYIQPGQRYVFYGDYDPDEGFRMIGATPSPDQIFSRVHLSCGSCFLQDGILRTPDGSWSTDGEEMVQAVAKLDGTLEEFLADPDNALWVRQMEDWELRQSSVPVLGTPALDTFYVFMKHQAEMVEGRMFTQAEYDAGSRVCILSDSLAARSGLKVGDTISLSQFACIEENESINVMMPDGYLNNPTIGSPIVMPEFVTKDEEFTIVGLYSLRDEWVDTSYSITPNTVFIPQKAQIRDTFGGPNCEREVSGAQETYQDGKTVREIFTEVREVENGSFGIYLSIELVNGKMEDFLLDISQDPVLKGQFHTVDMGLEKAFKSIEAMDSAADKLLLTVGLGWLMLLAVYVVLYQGGQRRNLGIMRSLGASPAVARRYLFESGMTLAAAGVALGGGLSMAIFGVIQSKLTESTLAQVDKSAYSAGIGLTEESLLEMVHMSQVSPAMLALLCGLQLALVALVLWLHANYLSRRKPRTLLGV